MNQLLLVYLVDLVYPQLALKLWTKRRCWDRMVARRLHTSSPRGTSFLGPDGKNPKSSKSNISCVSKHQLLGIRLNNKHNRIHMYIYIDIYSMCICIYIYIDRYRHNMWEPNSTPETSHGAPRHDQWGATWNRGCRWSPKQFQDVESIPNQELIHI